MDGMTCDQDQAFCYHGSCPSHNAQCHLLWGPDSKSSEFCYRHNIEGSQYQNCGYDTFSKNPIKCKQQDVKCGSLQCTHTNQGILADTGAPHQRWWTIEERRSIDCRSLSGTPGMMSMDLGLVPNGAKCDDDKLCLDQKCVSVSSLPQKPCPMSCSGNGVCNSKGNCHCYVGFSPPLCEPPGPGGSLDSGVVKDLRVLEYYAIALFVVFLGIIPLIILAIILVRSTCYKHNSPRKETPAISGSWFYSTNEFDCCTGNFCKQLHGYMLCTRSRKTNQQDVIVQKGSNLSSVQTKLPKQENVTKRNFNISDEAQKSDESVMSKKKLPGLSRPINKHETSAIIPSTSIASDLAIEFNPRTNSKYLKKDSVQTNKVFFESLDLNVKKPNVDNTKVCSDQKLSKSSSLHKKSKGLHLNMPTTKQNQMKTRLLRTPDSASTPETPPVEKYFQTVSATKKELVRKAGVGMTTHQHPAMPPPPPPAILKPRF